jgi:hypothetical protein
MIWYTGISDITAMGLLLYGFDSLVTEIYFFMFDLRFNGLVGCQAIE